jgi:hypothetical protein
MATQYTIRSPSFLYSLFHHAERQVWFVERNRIALAASSNGCSQDRVVVVR